MAKILVTGGSGFIGSHTCLSLVAKGYEIIILDSFRNSKPNSIEKVLKICDLNNIKRTNIKVIKGDLREKDKILKVFEDAKLSGAEINGVIHFAGLKAVGESVRNPLLYWDCNLIGSINLFQVMDAYNCKTIVFSSSATIYGSTEKEFITEEESLSPANPYGNNKVAIETLLNDLYRSSSDEWKIASLRYFNPIGAHPSGLIGENPIGVPNNIFPYILSVAAGVNDELKIFGSDWPTKDGTGVRDYIHVMDLADGHVLALEHLFAGKGRIIKLNLGTGRGTSVMELVNTFQEVNKIKIPFVFTERRPGDVSRVVADNKLATNFLKWEPQRSLREMCKDGWEWKRLNPSGYD